MDKRILVALTTPMKRGEGAPLILVGPPGVGKTSIIDPLEDAGIYCKLLAPSTAGEGAFGVIPYPQTDASGRTELMFPPSRMVRELNDAAERDGIAVLNLDEFNSSTVGPSLQAPIMGLLLERMIGDERLDPRVRIIATMNPVSLGTACHPIALALANRAVFVDFKPHTEKEHSEYMLSLFASHKKDECPDLKGLVELRKERWEESWAWAVGLETAFHMRNAGKLNVLPKGDMLTDPRGWASERSWETDTRLLATAKAINMMEVADELIAGAIGHGAASSWSQFRAVGDLPDPAKVLDGIEQFEHDPRRIDRTAVFVQSLAAQLISTSDKAKRSARAVNFWKAITPLSDHCADLVELSVSVVLKADDTLRQCKEGSALLHKLMPYMKAAGAFDGSN